MMNMTSTLKTADKINEDVKIYDKIQQGKLMFRASGVKKTGRNNFQKYSYFTLEDILSAMIPICIELKLSTRFVFSATAGNMIIRDEEDGSECFFTTPLPEVKNENPRKAMQDIGALQTYARRYLYLQAFEIEEVDTIDAGVIKQQKTSKQYRPNTQKTVKKQGTKIIQKKQNKNIESDNNESVDQTTLHMEVTKKHDINTKTKKILDALEEQGINGNPNIPNCNRKAFVNKAEELYKNDADLNGILSLYENECNKHMVSY